MKSFRFFSRLLTLFLAVLLLWSLPSSSFPQARAATPAEKFIQEQQESYASQREELANFLEESRGEIDHTLSLTPSTLLDGEASPAGEFLVDSAYPVHLFEHPDFVSYYREHGRIDTNIQPDYRWNVPTSNGYLVAVGQTSSGAWEKISMIGTDFLPTEGLPDISGVFDREKLLKTIESYPDIQTVSQISYIDSPMYTSTTFIYIRSGEQEFLIPYSPRPDFTGLENGKLYPMEDAADILEATSPQQVYSSDDEAIYGGGGASPESPVSLADGNSTLLIAGGIVLAALLIGAVTLLLAIRKRSKR